MEQLKLENQLCFPLYTASRLVIRSYTPFLEKLGITYPQYLVMLVLWEHGAMPVTQIAKLLWLDTNTLTPLLKRLESIGYISRKRLSSDERVVMIELTEAGDSLRNEACLIPEKLISGLNFTNEELAELYRLLYKYIRQTS